MFGAAYGWERSTRLYTPSYPKKRLNRILSNGVAMRGVPDTSRTTPLLIEPLFPFRYSRNFAVQLYTFSFCRVPLSDARSGIRDKRKPEATKAPKFLRAASD